MKSQIMTVIAALVIGAAGFYGYKYYNNHSDNTATSQKKDVAVKDEKSTKNAFFDLKDLSGADGYKKLIESKVPYKCEITSVDQNSGEKVYMIISSDGKGKAYISTKDKRGSSYNMWLVGDVYYIELKDSSASNSLKFKVTAEEEKQAEEFTKGLESMVASADEQDGNGYDIKTNCKSGVYEVPSFNPDEFKSLSTESFMPTKVPGGADVQKGMEEIMNKW